MGDVRGRLHDKVVMVTGGGNGIGRAICVLFAREGARLVIVDNDGQALGETAKILKRGACHVIKADVTNADDVKRAFVQVESTFGQKCDVVVNNAGVLGEQNVASDITEQSFDKVINVNLKGVFLVAREYLNSVKTVDKDIRGVLINTSSLAAKIGFLANSEYAASKGGIVAFSRTIANEFAVHRVRCNAILPGFTDTALLNRVDPSVQGAIRKAIPMQRHGTPEEIAYGFLYLASDESSYVHGASLEISGGL